MTSRCALLSIAVNRIGGGRSIWPTASSTNCSKSPTAAVAPAACPSAPGSRRGKSSGATPRQTTEPDVLAAGAERVRSYAARSLADDALIGAGPAPTDAWLDAAIRAFQRLLDPSRPSGPAATLG